MDEESHVSDHETIRVSLASASSPLSPPTDEANELTNLSVERAAALFSSTSAAMMDMGQHVLSMPPMVWNGLVLDLIFCFKLLH